MTDFPRVLIVDHHMLVAEAISRLLQSDSMRAVGIVTRDDQVLDAVETHRPDVVLIELGLPGRGGLEMGRRILERNSEVKLVAITAAYDSAIVHQALDLGFHGYVTKDTPAARFVAAVRAAAEGQMVVPEPAGRVALGARSNGNGHSDLLASHLTPREIEVLGLLVEGADSREIGRRLHVSSNTVRTHVQNLLSKLQVHSRLQAAAYAVRLGVIRTNPDRYT